LATRDELLKTAAAIEGTRIESKVAVLRRQDVLWSREARPDVGEPAYEEQCREMFRAVRRTGHTCDVIGPGDEFKPYGVLLAPMCMIVDTDLVDRLESWVKGGGMLLLTPHSGTRTLTNATQPAPRPGLFAPLAGVSIEEVIPCPAERGNTLNFARGGLIAQQCPVHGWLEVLICEIAEAIGEYVDGRLKGKPAISRRILENGQVYYLGAYLGRNILEAFLADLLRDYPVKAIPEGVEFSQRKGPNGRIVFAINHTAGRQELKLPGKFTELISGETIGPSVKLSAHGILVLQA
jgi:beta-galactosidase